MNESVDVNVYMFDFVNGMQICEWCDGICECCDGICEWMLGIGLLEMGLYIYASVIFAVGMTSKDPRLAKNYFFFLTNSSLTGSFKMPEREVFICDGL